MKITNFLAIVAVICFSEVPSSQSDNRTKKQKQNGLDKLLDKVIREIPKKDARKFFSPILENENKIIMKRRKEHLTISPAIDEQGTKKSTEPLPEPDSEKSAISVALSKPNVYFVDFGAAKTPVESVKKLEYNTVKRFQIPQWIPKHRQTPHSYNQENNKPDPLIKYDRIIYIQPDDKTNDFENSMSSKITSLPVNQKAAMLESQEYRAKRQESSTLDEGFPMLGSVAGLQTVPVQTLNTVVPAQNTIGDLSARSDVSAIDGNSVVAMVPVKVQTPMVSPSSVAMVSQTPQVIQREILGTSRSSLPVATLTQTSPDVSTRALRGPDVGNVLVKLDDRSNRFTTSEDQERKLKLRPEDGEDNETIKLTQVPLSILDDKTRRLKDIKTVNSNARIREDEDDSNAIKLNQIWVEPSGSEIKHTGKAKMESEKKDEIDRETLKTLQSRLTNIISKLEGKMKKKQGQSKLKQPKKQESLGEIAKNKPSEKSLKLLKKRLSHVLKKFNSKPGASQAFTIGKEWRNVLPHDHADEEKNMKLKKTQNTTKDEGNWPSIASQLLRKLNRALVKIQELRVARSLGKDAAMYLSFDKPNDELVKDLSGHFNDASVLGKAHASSRKYGSCGQALILNSGNLRFTNKYKTPTTAITLAMWVRTNATGYVKWFARDPRQSGEFNTHTRYPLVHKNVWTHLCGTFNSSTGITRIYVDGQLKTEKVNRQQETVPADFTPAGIGPEFGDDSLIAVDEVYMFARALDPKEVRTLYDNCEFNRMILHYGFQKINRTAGVVFDQSGLQNIGQLQGDARVLDSGCEKCGSCLDLNAKSNPRLTIRADHFKHRPTKAISVGAWFNLNSTTGVHPLFSVTQSISKSTLLDLLVTDGKLQWRGYNKEHNAIFNMATTQAVVPEGVWVHIVATFDSFQGDAKIFIDGHQKALAKTAKKVPIAEDWNEIKIGGDGSRVQSPGGYMDEFVLYNWELEPSEISYIMKYCPDHPKLVSFTVHVPLD